MQARVYDGKYKGGILNCAKQMYIREGGFASFYRGFGSQWIRIAPLATIQLVLWEVLRQRFGFDQI
jgi:hypothetical protein